MIRKLGLAIVGSILGLVVLASQPPPVAAWTPIPNANYGWGREWTNGDSTLGNDNCPWFGVSLRAPDLSYTMAAYQANFHIVIYNADNTSQIFVNSFGGASAVGTYRFPGFDPTRANSWDVFLCGVPGASVNGRYLVRVTVGGSVNSTVQGVQNYPINTVERVIQLGASSPHHFMDVMMTPFQTIIANPLGTYTTPNIDRSFYASTWAYNYYPGGTTGGLGNIDGIADTGFQGQTPRGIFAPGITYMGVNKPSNTTNSVSFQPGNPNYNYDSRGQAIYGPSWPYPYADRYYFRLVAYDKTPTGDPYHGSINTGLPLDGSVVLAANVQTPQIACFVNGTGPTINSCPATLKTTDSLNFAGLIQNTSRLVSDSGVRLPAGTATYQLLTYDVLGNPTVITQGTLGVPEILPNGNSQWTPQTPNLGGSLTVGVNYTLQICPDSTIPMMPSAPGGDVCGKLIFTPVAGPPSKPGGLSPSASVPCGSTSVTLSWTASTYATSYRVYVNGVLLPTVFAPTTSTTYNISPGTTYSWHVIADNAAGSTDSAPPNASFTDPICKTFTLSAPTPPNIVPGAPTYTSANISVATYTGSWTSGDKVNATLQKVVAGASCSSAAAAGFSYTLTSGSMTYTTPPPSFSIYSFGIKASSGVATGPYTLCFSVSTTGANMSPANPTSVTMPLNVNYTSWLQVGSAGGAAGDIYSYLNSYPSIQIQVPGSNANTFLFANGVAGVVSASAGTNISTASGAGMPSPNWKVLDNSQIKSSNISSNFATLLAAAKKNGPFVEKADASDSGGLSNGVTGCNGGAGSPKISQIYKTSTVGNYQVTGPNQVTCNVLFVGSENQTSNLTISTDIIPGAPGWGDPLVFIVNGNVSVSASVQQINATIIYTGTFTDSGSSHDSPFTLDGSLINISDGSGGNMGLTRNLDNNTLPAENFIYQPGLLNKLIPWLGQAKYNWVEKG